MKKDKKTLVVVAGAAGEIGTEFIRESLAHNMNIIGVIRNTPIDLSSENLQTIQ